jgi:hypothetical protein
MMKQLINLLLINLLIALPFDAAKSQIAIGQWRDHLPYNRGIRVADVGDVIYCATDFGLFSYDKDEKSIHRMSKVNGLSDVGISALAYSESYKTLIIAYTNTNIDLIKEGKIINISDIKRSQILGNKTINNITLNDSLAYLACGFGIVVLDIQNEEFPEPTYFIGDEGAQINVFDLTFGMDTIYAATEQGIYKASVYSPNLADFSQWSVDQQLYPNSSYSLIMFYSDNLIANLTAGESDNDTLFLHNFSTNTWEIMPETNHVRKQRLVEANNKLLVVSRFDIFVYNSDLALELEFGNPGVFLNSRDATIDKNNIKWVADNRYGLVGTADGLSATVITPNGPFSQRTFNMSLEDGSLWVASGGRSLNWAKTFNRDGVFSFTNESWENFNSSSSGFSAFDTISDMVCVVVSPQDNRQVYVGTWHEGVIEFFDNKVANVYSKHNSSLQPWVADQRYTLISGLAFDSNSNLWAVNSGAPELLSVKKPTGDWRSFSLGSANTAIDASKLYIDRFDQKWILVRADHKLIVFTDNGTIDDISDDKVKTLTNSPGSGNVPGNKILSLAEDLDGRMWIGTDQGIAVIYSPGNIFNDGDYDAQRILVEVGGYVQYLLESEVVTAIAVDGDNRKWIGTERAGVFLVSANGTEQIHHFTEDNSPLFSNFIVDIAINHKTGEVFFATDRGIISYKSTATQGQPTISDVVVYPNPVRQGYTGDIAINGLVTSADVKITDISGSLIFATKAEGGQAVWNGTSMNGRRASTGVYLVFATDDQGNEKMVAKILFIN